MHQKLDPRFQNGPLLDGYDKETIGKIELYVDQLVATISKEQLKKIVTMDKLIYLQHSLAKQKQKIISRLNIISKLTKQAEMLGQNLNIEDYRQFQPFKKLKMQDQDKTISDILNITDVLDHEVLMTRLKDFERDSEKEIKLIDLNIASVRDEGNQEYQESDQVVKDYFNYKHENGYKFELSDNGELLKISRSMKGTKFSVIYFDPRTNGENEQKQRHKMVLYTGKDRVLGYGKSGKVKLLQDFISNLWYAVKIQSTRDNKFYHHEVDNLIKVNMFFNSVTLLSRDKHYIAMELVKGVEVLELICRYLKVSGNDLEVLRVLSSAAKALQDLHDNKMIHRDVKPENFVCEGQNCKMIDYQFLVEVDKNNQYCDQIFLGTEGYLAPEIVEAKKTDAKKFTYGNITDIYAFGIILDNVAKLLNNHEIAELMKSYALLFTQAAELRSKNLKGFIESADNLLARPQPSATTMQPPLLFTGNHEYNSPSRKKANLQENTGSPTKLRF